MGGFSGSGGGGQFAQLFSNMFPQLQSKLGGFLNQFQQGGQQQSGGAGGLPGGTPMSGQGGASYPGFQMPAYTWHRSMPQFNLGAPGGYQPAQQPNPQPYGGMLNLPGWQMQQAGQAGGTATGWRPTVGTQSGGGSGGGNTPNDPFRQLMTQGYAYLPGQGMATLDPQWFSPDIKSAVGPLDLRTDSDWQKLYG